MVSLLVCIVRKGHGEIVPKKELDQANKAVKGHAIPEPALALTDRISSESTRTSTCIRSLLLLRFVIWCLFSLQRTLGYSSRASGSFSIHSCRSAVSALAPGTPEHTHGVGGDTSTSYTSEGIKVGWPGSAGVVNTRSSSLREQLGRLGRR